MILWYFFHKYFIQKKKQSIRCLSLLDREGDGVAKWIRVGNRGDRWAENPLLSKAEADRSAETETYIFLSFICMLYECLMSGKYVFNICFYFC